MGRLGLRKRQQRNLGSSRRRHEPGDEGFRLRASPARIMKLYPHLLRIHCPWLPASLCAWLIRRYDPESCELVIDSVHRVLGIPNSGRDVEYKLDEKSIEFVLDKHGVTKPPSVQSLVKSIKQMKTVDEHFLRTFMMLVLSTFLCPNSGLRDAWFWEILKS